MIHTRIYIYIMIYIYNDIYNIHTIYVFVMLRVAQISSSPQKREDVGCPILLGNPADSCEGW